MDSFRDTKCVEAREIIIIPPRYFIDLLLCVTHNTFNPDAIKALYLYWMKMERCSRDRDSSDFNQLGHNADSDLLGCFRTNIDPYRRMNLVQ